MEILQHSKTKLGNIIELLGERKDNNILIVGVVHGDEPQGKFLIEEYLNLPIAPYKKEDCKNHNNLLFIPCLNPDGMQLKTRTNSNGIDINRNFPTKNWGRNEGDNATCDDENTNYFGGKSAGSEIETKFLIDTIKEYKPKLILTLHSPYKIVNYDGPAEKIAKKISQIINYPAEASIGYPTPGSFGTWAGVERNIPVITLELDEKIPVKKLVPPIFEIFDMLIDI